MVRCTLSVSCSTDLDYGVVFVDRVGVFLEHMHRTFTATERFTPNFASFLFTFLSFGSRRKHHNRCNIHSKLESITGQPASKSVVMTKLPGSSRTLVFVLRTKAFANTILEHYSQTVFAKTVRILRTDLSNAKCENEVLYVDTCVSVLSWFAKYMQLLQIYPLAGTQAHAKTIKLSETGSSLAGPKREFIHNRALCIHQLGQ